MKKLLEKFKEVGIAIIPLVAVVLLLHFFSAKLDTGVLVNFIIGTVMVVVGEVFFLAGVDNSIITMGEASGATISRFKYIWLVLAFGFVFGFICTIAEPDVQVLGQQVQAISNGAVKGIILILIIALGVGIYTALALLRAVTKIKLRTLLLFSYILVFALAAFSVLVLKRGDFIGISYDSGGVTTGPITVPFILALGIGAASVKGGTKNDDSFGMVGLASVGPIMAMIIMGMFITVDHTAFDINNMYQVHSFGSVLLAKMGDVAIGLAPITVIFILFQFFFIKLPRKKVLKVLAGVAVVYVGLVLFLGGVDFGFSKAALDSGFNAAAGGGVFKYLLIPIGAVIGVATVYTEPAISVLGKQVEEVTSGQIKGRVLKLALAVGIGIAVTLGIIKSLFAISLWWFIIPGYIISLAFMFFSPEIFTAIAFDSGGVASGPMTATFSLPLVIGICAAMGEPVMEYAFGLVALVALMPLIVIQALGVLYKVKASKLEKERKAQEEKLAVPAEEDKDFSGLI